MTSTKKQREAELEEMKDNDRLYAEYIQHSQGLAKDEAMNISINMREQGRLRQVGTTSSEDWQRKVYGAGR